MIWPSPHVVESELLDNNTRKITEKYVQRSTIQILKKNTVEEIQEFRKDFPGRGLGECDSMLTSEVENVPYKRIFCV